MEVTVVVVAFLTLVQTLAIEWMRRHGRRKAYFCPRCGAAEKYKGG